ncbi:3-keto-5-aminohexanoate cleavage enzyme [compost metagenome]
MMRTADRLFGDSYHWSVLGVGAMQPRIAMQSLLLGGHVRVGLEDNLWLGKGRLAQSNAEQVRAIKAMIESLGFAVATPDEARAIMQLKGRDHVNF